jgi:DinB superfamily
MLLLMCFPAATLAQTAPVADAFRANTKRIAHRLVLSAEAMPEAKYRYKPTAAQMTFGEVVVHLAEDNDIICSTLTGMPAPTRAAMAATDTKAHLVARLKETFGYCDQALAALDDTKLGETLSFAGLP